MTAQYYAFLEGQVSGPFDVVSLRSLNLSLETQVCLAGTEEWILLRQEPALLPPLDATRALPNPLTEGDRIPLTDRKKVFIIHGKGNSLDHAFGLLIELMRVKFRYFRGEFYVDEVNSNFARYILYEDQPNPWLNLVDRTLVGKLALSPIYPPPPDWIPDRSWTKLSSYKVSEKLGYYGVPTLADGKKSWCDSHFTEIWNQVGRMLGEPISGQPVLNLALENLRQTLRPGDGGLFLEWEYKDAIRAHFSARSIDPEPFLGMLLELQRLNDGGGDLDTIASNALYGAWLLQAWWAARGEMPRYGRDFEFDFVNYHQSFLHLSRHRNAEIYLPDFPMDAIPDLGEAAQALAESGSGFVRIDDHHPLGQDKIDLLSELKELQLVGDWVMSGPMKGTEQPAEERTCGADLVHYAALKGTPYDAPGLEELRRLAHQQDLHFIADPDDRSHPDYLAVDLSKLIGSRYSRIDMAQQLMFVRTFEDIRNVMETTGWRQIVDRYEEELETILPKLESTLVMIEFLMPDEVGKKMPPWLTRTLKIASLGAFDLETFLLRRRSDTCHRVLMTLAPFQSRKEPRVNVASAIGYLKRFYRFDYFFYAWGASLLTTRRYNGDDHALDLSTLMAVIGGPGDGGHSSAASCKPPSNAHWPADRFRKLNGRNFLEYARYIASRVEGGTSAKVVNVRAISKNDRDFHQ